MFGKLQAWLAALGVALLGIGAAWLRGRSQGNADAAARDDKAYRETRERIDNATNDNDGLSDGAVRDRLREHAKRAGDL